jgi:hypothetical protein
LALSTISSKVLFDTKDPDYKNLLQAIGYLSTHDIHDVFVYAEEAQNLKEGKWYPYKVFFPTPKGWLKVDNHRLVFMKNVGYKLAQVEIEHVLNKWEGMDDIVIMLGLIAPKGRNV